MEHESTELPLIPTYHWSEIASPRYRDLSLALLSGSVSVTQKVHRRNETPKVTKVHSAFVVYDSDFVKFKLLEAVVPFLTEYFQKRYYAIQLTDSVESLSEEITSELTTPLSEQFIHSIVFAVLTHLRAYQACSDIGLDLNFDRHSILRSFKLEVERNYKTAQAQMQPLQPDTCDRASFE